MNERKLRKKIAKVNYKIEKFTAKAKLMRNIGKEPKATKCEKKAQKHKFKIYSLEAKLLTVSNNQSINRKRRMSARERIMNTETLNSIMQLEVPEHIESGTLSELIVRLHNASNLDFTDLTVNLSDMANYFDVETLVQLPLLKIGAATEKRIKFRQKHGDGVYPFVITISGNGVNINREFTIKVGGTEIY
jgi:hypothetical protein